jgi:hypothetical protein
VTYESHTGLRALDTDMKKAGKLSWKRGVLEHLLPRSVVLILRHQYFKNKFSKSAMVAKTGT